MPSILFVCTGNQYRSPIAAAAFRKQLSGLGMNFWRAESAGTWVTPGLLPSPKAIQLAQDLGLDLTNHRTRVVSASELARHDLILVMEQGHKEALRSEFPAIRGKVYLLSEVVEGVAYDIPDPANPHVDARQVACSLEQMIERGISKIIALAESLAKA